MANTKVGGELHLCVWRTVHILGVLAQHLRWQGGVCVLTPVLLLLLHTEQHLSSHLATCCLCATGGT